MLTAQNAVLLLVIISNFWVISQAIVCTKDFCDHVTCEELDCAPDQFIKKGGFCFCCDKCYTILGENQTCGLQLHVLGLPPPTTVCGKGLECVDRICQKVAQETKSFEDTTQFSNSNDRTVHVEGDKGKTVKEEMTPRHEQMTAGEEKTDREKQTTAKEEITPRYHQTTSREERTEREKQTTARSEHTSRP